LGAARSAVKRPVARTTAATSSQPAGVSWRSASQVWRPIASERGRPRSRQAASFT